MSCDRGRGAVFRDAEVARSYEYRAPYAKAAFEHLVHIAPATRRLLDLGCGPGKIAHALASRFDAVDAVDPSAAMLEVARERPSKIRWMEATAEDAALTGRYDLVTAGASVHWMDPAVVFPKLRSHLAEDGAVAFLDGDGAHQSAWEDEWNEVIRRWLSRLGQVYDAQKWHRDTHEHENWIDVLGRQDFVFEYAQKPEHFVEREHSRATWARSQIGAMADEMDEELRGVVASHIAGGLLHFTVRTQVMWGTPRSAPRLQS